MGDEYPIEIDPEEYTTLRDREVQLSIPNDQIQKEIKTLEEKFVKWYLEPKSSGVKSLYDWYMGTARDCARSLPENPALCDEALRKHSGWLTTANAMLAEAEQFCHQGEALWTEYLASKGFSPTQAKKICEGRCSSSIKVARQFERLSRSITHRMEAARTLISKAKMELERGQVN